MVSPGHVRRKEREIWDISMQRDLQEAEDSDSCSCLTLLECQNDDAALESSRRTPVIRVAVSATAARRLEPYLMAFYEVQGGGDPQRKQIQFTAVPSFRELQFDIRQGTRQNSWYSGFVIPPEMMGDLLEVDGLKTLALNEEGEEPLVRYWQDLLPYYKKQISLLDGQVRGLPLLAGNQPLLLYRKDYLQATGMDLSVPATWGEYIRVASLLHQQPLGPSGSSITGSCLGRMSEAACSKRMDMEEDDVCESSSLAYFGMILASMTQTSGSASGWLFDDETMRPLLNPSFETTLVYLEQQLRFGADNELLSDSSINLEMFRQGQCGMTIAFDHPEDLLNDPDVGFAPVPGSHNFLERSANVMANCTPELCPFSVQDESLGNVNHAPYGSLDMMVGAVSARASPEAAAALEDFFEFVTTRTPFEGLFREQPLTYTDLQAFNVTGYSEVMQTLTESENVAVPLKIPNSFSLLSEIDNQIYNYLSVGEFSQSGREQVRRRVEASLERMIQQRDARSTVPTSIFYEKALGTFVPATSPDIYIGDVPRIIGWSLGGISCFLSLYFAFWVWRNQDEAVVKNSQKIFLNMICFGTFMMSSCIFLFGIEDDIASTRTANRSCMGSMWLYSIGYVIIVSALSSKIWLINKIFRKAKNLHRIRVEWVDFLWPFLIIGGMNIVLLIVWNIHDPVKWERAPVTETETHLNLEEVPTYGYCNSEHFRIYFGLVMGINYIFSLVALAQAYECRKISTDYLESLWISGSIAFMVQVWTVGLPLLKLLDNHSRDAFLVKVGVVSLTTLSPLLLIFLPKIGYTQQSRRYPGEMENHDNSLKISYRDDSVTSHETDSSPLRKSQIPTPGTGFPAKKGQNSDALHGIRILQSSNRHGEELEKLQRSLRHAEARNRSLSERLERMQEKLERYIVSRDYPVGGNHRAHNEQDSNFILSAKPIQKRH